MNDSNPSVYSIKVFTLLDKSERDIVIDRTLAKERDEKTLKTEAFQKLVENKIISTNSWPELQKLGMTLNICVDKVIELIKKTDRNK